MIRSSPTILLTFYLNIIEVVVKLLLVGTSACNALRVDVLELSHLVQKKCICE